MKLSSGSAASCASCMRCMLQDINGNILCRDKGITSYNYRCNRYKVKHAYAKPSKSMSNTFITCSKCNYFDTRNSKVKDTGTCLYYKLRPFPGNQRKGCSNFLMSESEFYAPDTQNFLEFQKY
jgi:hypothetical protein